MWRAENLTIKLQEWNNSVVLEMKNEMPGSSMRCGIKIDRVKKDWGSDFAWGICELRGGMKKLQIVEHVEH